MLSHKARYALRALVELAIAGADRTHTDAQLTSGELAARADAPRKFLEAILLELSPPPPGDQPPGQVRRLCPGPPG